MSRFNSHLFAALAGAFTVLACWHSSDVILAPLFRTVAALDIVAALFTQFDY